MFACVFLTRGPMRVVMFEQPDLEVKAKTFNTISDVKKLLQHMKTIKMEKQKVLFMGRLLPDASTLGAAGLQDGNVLQIMVSS